MNTHHSAARRILTGSIAALALAAAAQAQTFNWNIDGGGSWITDTNWTPTIAGDWPKDPADVANFTFNLTQAAAITLDAPITVGALTIGDTNATHTYTLSNGAGGSLNFDNSGSAATLTQTATGLSDVIAATLTTAGDLNVVNANTTAGRTFTLSSPLSSSALSGTQLVTFNQSNANAAVLISGAISNGVTGGTVALSKTGSGTLTLGATNSYTGGTTLTAGTIVGNAVGALTGTFTQGATSTLRINNYAVGTSVDVATGATINASGGTLTLNSNAVTGNALSVALTALNVSGNYAIRADNNGTALATATTFTLAAPMTITGNPTITSNSGTNASVTIGGLTTLNSDVTVSPTTTFRFNGVAEDATPRKITKTGTGTLNLVGASTYTGGTDVLNGVLQVNVTGGASTGLIQLGDTVGANNAEIRAGIGATVTNVITVRAGSTGTAKIARDSSSTGGTGTYSGLITLNKATIFENASGATAGTSTLDITGQITGANQKITVTRGGSANSQFVRFTNVLNDFGFAAATDDAITVGNGIFLFPSDAVLGAAGNNITLSGTASNFRAEGTFSTARKLTFNAAGAAVDATSGNELALTANNQIAGTAVFTKGLTAGTVVITGDNSARTLGTNVVGGTLRISGSINIGTTSPIGLAGGTLSVVNDTAATLGNAITLTASSTLNADRATGGVGDGLTHTFGPVTIGANTLTTTNANNYSITLGAVSSTAASAFTNNIGGTGILTIPSIAVSNAAAVNLTLRGTGSTVVTGAITQTGAGVVSLVKDNAGVVTLQGAGHTYAGATTITNGTLRLTLNNQLSNSTGISVAAGGTLDLRSDTAIGNTIPLALNSSTATLNVDRAVGGSGTGQTHSVTTINVGTTTTPNITGGNGYGLNVGTTNFVDSAGLRNDAPGLVTITNLNVTNAAAKTLTLRGTGNTAVTNGINQAGAGVYGLTKLDTGSLAINAASSYTGNTAVGNSTTNGGTLQLGAAGAIPNTAISVLSGVLDLNNFGIAPTSLALGGGPAATSATINGNGATITLASGVTYNTNSATFLGAFINASIALGGATRTFTVGDTTGADPDLTVSGAISDATGSLTKLGTGQFRLAGSAANTWIGSTLVGAGQLQLAKTAGVNAVPGDVAVNPSSGHSSLKNFASEQIPDSAVVTFTGTSGIGGGHWDLNGFDETVAGLAWNNNQGTGSEAIATGVGTLTVLGNITFAGTSAATTVSPVIAGLIGNIIDGKLSLGGAVRTIDTPTATGAGGIISAVVSSGGILKTGSNLLVLSGANTYAGGTDVQAGTLDLRNVSALGAGNVSLTGGNLTLKHNGDGTTTPETFNYSGAVTISANTTLIADRIGGTATTKTLTVPSISLGGQTVTVTANNSYTFGVVGPVSLTASPTFNVTAGTFALAGGASDSGGGFGITKQGAGAIAFNAASSFQSLTLTGGMASGSGLVTLTDTVAPLTFRNNTLAGNYLLSAGSGGPVTFDATSNGTGTISGTLDLGSVPRSLNIANGTATPDTTVSGVLAGSGGWSKDGLGALTLSGTAANTYSGTVQVNAGTLSLAKTAGVAAITGDLSVPTGGTVSAAADNQIADTANLSVNGGLIIMNGRDETFASLNLTGLGNVNTLGFATGTLAGDPANTTVTGTVTINGDPSSAGGNLTVNSGNAGATLTANKVVVLGGASSGAIVIGSNTTSRLVVQGGGFEISNQASGAYNALQILSGTAGGILELQGGLTFTGNANANSVGLVAVTGGAVLGRLDLAGADRLFDIGDGAAPIDLFISTNIINGSLTKDGDGTLEIRDIGTAHGYTGTTTINEGTLLLSGSIAGSVSVGADGTLAGTGSVGGAATINGLLSPGASPGTLAVGDALTFGNNSALVIELGGAAPGDGAGFYDQVNMTNAAASVTIGTNVSLSLALIDGYVPFDGDDFYILTRADAAAFGGTFAGLAEGATVNLGGGYSGTLTYLADWTGTHGGSFEAGGNDVAVLNVVPEPGSLAALLAGFGALTGLRRFRRRA